MRSSTRDRISTFWPLVVATVVLLLVFVRAGWKPAPALILAVLSGSGVWIATNYVRRWVRQWFDARRGLEVREFRAINAMSWTSQQSDFDRWSRVRLRGCDDEILIGYATVWAHLLIESRMGQDPSDRDLDVLAYEAQERWLKVVRQKSARLRRMLELARDYEKVGFAESNWDNVRAMAGAVGAVRAVNRSVPVSWKQHGQSFRLEVARRYDAYVDDTEARRL